MKDFAQPILARWRAASLMQRAAGLAGLITVFLLAMIGVEQMRRSTGAEIVVLTRPVDPRDLLRGAYVQLEYELERIHLPDLPSPADPSDWRAGDVLYVGVRDDGGGLWRPVSVGVEKPGGVSLRVTYLRREDFADVTAPGENMPVDILVDLGADRYFADPAAAKHLENEARQAPLHVILSVGADGKAVIKGLVINGQKQYETLF